MSCLTCNRKALQDDVLCRVCNVHYRLRCVDCGQFVPLNYRDTCRPCEAERRKDVPLPGSPGTIRARLKSVRTARRMTMADAARELHVSTTTWHGWESGARGTNSRTDDVRDWLDRWESVTV